ncbi:hypothetical protein AX15_003476 [Amanita polypyramis BW_CC]|nr:hypothetical protein AX15_003476 [Amanita polypyramis BW_CC]
MNASTLCRVPGKATGVRHYFPASHAPRLQRVCALLTDSLLPSHIIPIFTSKTPLAADPHSIPLRPVMSNATTARCYMETAQTPPSLFQNGNIVVQLHHVGWLVTGIFTMIATVLSAWLIAKHLGWYTDKFEQRYIVRILFLVPIYAIISFASYLFWGHSTPLLLIRDCYESVVLTAFFYLLLMYLSHEPEEQRRIFAKCGLSREADRDARARGELAKKWVFPLQFVNWKPQDGLYFLQLMKYGILQYTVVRPVTTLIAVLLNYFGLYCESSWSLHWGHIYISAAVSISVTVAMFCLVQFYVSVSKLLAPRQPLLKLFSIKAVVFLTFWQSIFLSVLSTFGIIKNTKYMTAEDVNIGIGALLETFEMTLFAFIHIKAFSYLPYRPSLQSFSKGTSPQPTPRLRSLGHAMDFRETCRELWAGCVYLFDKARGREPSADHHARRAGYYENAFARPRPPQRSTRATEKASSSRSAEVHRPNNRTVSPPRSPVYVQVEREVNIDGQRQWLGTGDDYIYGLEFMRSERSESLELQIERELARRGYAPSRPLPEQEPLESELLNGPVRPARNESRPSWWRSIYRRLSHSDPGAEDWPSPPILPHKPRILSRSRRSLKSGEHKVPLLSSYPANLEGLPPRSILGTYQWQEQKNHSPRGTDNDGDVLMPLPVFQDTRPGNSSNRPGYRQNVPIVTVDREATLPPPAINHPLSSLDVNTGYLAPGSSRTSRYSRDDSLLGRLFPDSMTEGDSMSLTDFGTMNDGTQSILSMSTDGVGQVKKTPRARLTTTTPQIMVRGTMVDSSGLRAPLQSVPEQVQPSPGIPDPQAAELLVPDPTISFEGTQERSDGHRSRRPLPTPPTLTPPHDAAVHAPKVEKPPSGDPGPLTTRTIRHHTSRDDLDILPQRYLGKPRGLHRGSAQVRPRAMTESELLSVVYSNSVPRVSERTHARHDLAMGYPSPGPISTSSGQVSASHSPVSHSPNVSFKPVTRSGKAFSSPRDISHQVPLEVRGYNHSGAPHLSPLILESQVLPSSHKTKDSPSHQTRANPARSLSPHSHLQMNSHSPPSLRSPHSSDYAKPFNTINRLRKHQDGRHARSSNYSSEMSTSPSRTSQVTRSSSRTPISNYSSGTLYTPRNWRTVDYTSTSWYLPVKPDS